MSFFADKFTAEVARGRHSRKVPDQVAKRALRQIDFLNAAHTIEECRHIGHGRIGKRGEKPPRFYVHTLDQWWISFNWGPAGATEVRLEKT